MSMFLAFPLGLVVLVGYVSVGQLMFSKGDLATFFQNNGVGLGFLICLAASASSVKAVQIFMREQFTEKRSRIARVLFLLVFACIAGVHTFTSFLEGHLFLSTQSLFYGSLIGSCLGLLIRT